jgi:hypothetical protein
MKTLPNRNGRLPANVVLSMVLKDMPDLAAMTSIKSDGASKSNPLGFASGKPRSYLNKSATVQQ